MPIKGACAGAQRGAYIGVVAPTIGRVGDQLVVDLRGIATDGPRHRLRAAGRPGLAAIGCGHRHRDSKCRSRDEEAKYNGAQWQKAAKQRSIECGQVLETSAEPKPSEERKH